MKLAIKIRKLQRELQDTLFRIHPSWGLEQRAEQLVTLFENDLPAASSILDVGGGWGFYVEPLRRRGHRVIVCDVVKPGFQKAPIVFSENGRLPFPDKSFDVTLLVTVLHHVENLEPLLDEVRRVTRHVLIVVEDLYRHSLGRGWTILRDMLYNFEFFGHPCRFKKKEDWVRFFCQLGFSPLKEKDVYTWLAGMRILNGLFVLQVEARR